MDVTLTDAPSPLTDVPAHLQPAAGDGVLIHRYYEHSPIRLVNLAIAGLHHQIIALGETPNNAVRPSALAIVEHNKLLNVFDDFSHISSPQSVERCANVYKACHQYRVLLTEKRCEIRHLVGGHHLIKAVLQLYQRTDDQYCQRGHRRGEMMLQQV
ncbi:hypothetical protein ACLBW3_24145 [Enterobacteriaceae bacterium C34B]